MDKSKLTDRQKEIRMHIRNFLFVANREELEKELEISVSNGDAFRANCIRELIEEID